MLPLVRSRPQLIAGAVVAVSLLGVGFLPLFGGPGYEQSLASGLIVPSAAAIATACELSAGDAPGPLESVGRGVLSGGALAGVAFATALIQAMRAGLCDLVGGAVGFALTALFGSILGGVWGAIVAEVARGRSHRRLIAVTLALALPIGSALFSVGRFYTSPMIFAFDPFVGYFSGTLYDTVIDAGTSLLTYRVGSLATLVAVVLTASTLMRRPDGRLRFVPLKGASATGARVRLELAAVALVVSVGITLDGPALGHWETSTTIAKDLGGARSGARCDVVFPASQSPAESELLVKDCDEQLAAVEHRLGAHGPDRVRAFFFRDAADKKRLMGAADTLIAKPWRREVYVQLSTYPHPVLGHELAHVVAGSLGRGPFRIAGSLGGWWPDPGLIEGIAVAASPGDDELSNTQWVHAMLDLGVVPPIRQVFSLGFLGVAASKSYTLAGSFVRFVLDTYGSGVVRAWYGGASLEAETGKSWDALDKEFRAYAEATPLAPEAQSFAKARFERAAVFGRKCPHVVDALRRKADLCRDAHEADRATVAYHDVLAHDPHEWGARYGLGVVNLRYGDEAIGARALGAMASGEDTPRTWKDRARDALADEALLRGDDAQARAAYEGLASRSLEEDFARTEEVKALVATDPAGRPAVEALLIGAPKRPADIVVAATRAGEWEARTGSPLAAYLVGRLLVSREWYASAVPHLDHAIAEGAQTTPRIAREAIRLRAVVACATGDGTARDRMKALVLAKDGPYASSSGRRQAVLRLLDRCSVVPASVPAP
jgi:hypothetical protein